jgi:predicted DsbA family dithiol-disulfide isomerase
LYQKTYPGGKEDTFLITWTPYYLDYNPHPFSVEKHTLIDVRLPDTTPQQRTALTERMNRLGRGVGIQFNWGGKIGPHTRDAHRLIHLAQTRWPESKLDEDGEMQNTLVEGLFEAYHVLAQDVSERSVLRSIALRAGIDAAQVDRWLDSDEGASVVDQQAKDSKEMTNAGVPLFIIQKKHRIDSASDPVDLMRVFIQVRKMQSS